MMSRFRIRWDEPTGPAPIDLFLTTLGYESRSGEIARTVDSSAKRRIAIPFNSNQVLGFEANRSYFSKNGYEIPEVPEASFGESVALALLEIAKERPAPRVCVDVSCMTRERMAKVVLACLAHPGPMELELLYGLAAFQRIKEDDAPTLYHGPVLNEFAGWTRYPEVPSFAILGLGFEGNRLLGTLDHLEPSEWRAFLPLGADRRFEREVARRNDALLTGTKPMWISRYDVRSPNRLLAQLLSLLGGLVTHRSVVVLPFGPKVFCLASLLASATLDFAVGVWRVSAAEAHAPIDRHLDRGTVRLRISLRPAQQNYPSPSAETPSAVPS
ncbi:MAG: hypothetical protein K1X67_11180 [Fimbriimonadaceae bacterium]|nr:hypothetical protein [Fimbriimonadaceae bacterium]